MDLLSKRGRKGDLLADGSIGKEGEFVTLVDLARLTNCADITAEVIRDLCLHFELGQIKNYRDVAWAVDAVLRRGESLAYAGKSFDFADMIWLSVLWKLKLSIN
ncbi:hypothetical protein QM565_10535 [Geitlerinema splendidum]|nr:hypothetical protein [Geitlerinema splendidum]